MTITRSEYADYLRLKRADPDTIAPYMGEQSPSEHRSRRTNMKFYNEKTKELADTQIIAALKSAIKDYEDGAIIECENTLIDIVNAIREFDK